MKKTKNEPEKIDSKIEEKLEHALEGIEDIDKKEDFMQDLLGIGEISKQLIEKDKIKFLSNISPDIERSFSILYAVNSKLNSTLLATYLENSLILKTAISGKRADDLIEVTKNMGLTVAMAFGGNSSIMGEEKRGLLQGLRDKIK